MVFGFGDLDARCRPEVVVGRCVIFKCCHNGGRDEPSLSRWSGTAFFCAQQGMAAAKRVD
jgi:hypothetical protein